MAAQNFDHLKCLHRAQNLESQRQEHLVLQRKYGAPEFLVGNCGAGLNVQSACYPICYSLEVTECAVSSGSAACEL